MSLFRRGVARTTPASPFLLWPRGRILYLYEADVRIARSAEPCGYPPIARDWPCACPLRLVHLVKQSVTERLQGRNPLIDPSSVRVDESPSGRTREHRLPSPGGRPLYRAHSVRPFSGLRFIDFELGSRSGDAHLSISAHCVEDEGWTT